MKDQLSFSGKRWTVPTDTTDASAIIAHLKAKRGLIENATTDWTNPSVFPDSTKAAKRIHEAIVRKETVGIFGDYDCDGITSTGQLVRFFRRHNTEPIVRLPHRVTDGYGLKPSHIDELKKSNVTLLITVDTGISANDAIEKANENGIDVIILDHHHIRSVPTAYAILHPALSTMPEPHPSAAGVVFLFLHALEEGLWTDRSIDLALATFGTVADLVPLTGWNRRLVQEGLEALQQLPESPVKHLVESVTNGKQLSSIDIAFRIAPRINAAGRMSDPLLALHALLEGGDALKTLEKLNTERQQETQRATEHALMTIDPHNSLPHDRLPVFLAVADSSYQPGIIGLIAGKLTERFGRPSMAVSIRGDECTASFRSPPTYDITRGLSKVSSLLTTFGGHSQAAGATFALDHYMDLCVALEKDIEDTVGREALLPELLIDAHIDHHHLSLDTVNALKELEPYGQGNPEPLFLIRNRRLESVRSVGSSRQHLQATVGQCKLIGFGRGEWMPKTTEPVDIVCRLGLDHWNGETRVQLGLVDMRSAKTADDFVKF